MAPQVLLDHFVYFRGCQRSQIKLTRDGRWLNYFLFWLNILCSLDFQLLLVEAAGQIVIGQLCGRKLQRLLILILIHHVIFVLNFLCRGSIRDAMFCV